MNWQATGAGLTGGGASADPFAHVESDVRAMVASPWWRTAPPPQRADAIVRRMLTGAGEWWLFGAWGRWYRSGLDGSWHPCPPPSDPAARMVVGPTPPGYGNPPVPPQFFPVGPDLGAGRVATAGLLGTAPETTVVARLQQALIDALSVNPAQFALQDSTFAPGTPSTLAAAWGALLWCAGSPVVLTEHPLVELFVPYLTTPAHQLRWLTPPDISQLAAYYTARLGVGDGVGAAHVLRVLYEVATGLREDPRFRPAADALAAMAEASTRLVGNDLAAVRYGHPAVVQEWRRRCPAESAVPLLRDVVPGEYLRLALYDLAETVAALHGALPGHAEVHRAAIALLAADLQSAPNAVAAVTPWLDPDGARTLHAVLTQPAHPLRELWPQEGRLPDSLRTDDTAALESLLATSYSLALISFRLAGSPLQPGGFGVSVAAATELTDPAVRPPKDTGELTPWQIIDAARAHLAAQRAAGQEPGPAQPPAQPPAGEDGAAADAPEAAAPPPPPEPPAPSSPAPQVAGPSPAVPPAPGPPPPYPHPHPPGHAAHHEVPPAAAPPPAADPEATAYDHAPLDRTAHDRTAYDHTAPPPPPAWSAEPSAPPGPPAAAPPGAFPDPFGGPTPPPGAPVPGGPPAMAPPPVPPPVAPAVVPAVVPEPAGVPDPTGPGKAVPVAEAYGIRFLCGVDDTERLLSEVRRRGKWAQRLKGQQVSTASAPALLLIGAPSTGQRRLARMVARALADVDVSSGDVHGMQVEDLRERGPHGVRAALEEHAGHTVLLEGLDELILDDAQGRAYADALYRARVEGVSDTALVATCGPERFGELSTASPELVTDFRAVRLPDLSDPQVRTSLLALLAEERHVRLSTGAWEVVRADLGGLRGRGRLTNARLVEAYFDRACTRSLGRAGETGAIGDSGALLLVPADFDGLAAELQGPS